MKIITSIAEWRSIRSQLRNRSIGFVPTMGYLHAGHLSLFQQAKQESDIVIGSIFVNPLQFGVNEDFSTYPRDLERDVKWLEEMDVDYVFAPSVEEMYPSPISTLVSVKNITEMLCGASRPGHFDGVATVVLKLFQIIQPDFAYFGLKDAQQVAVINQMVYDLNVPVQIRPCPILREKDGLAMSSRNVYLSAEERDEATILYKTLQWAKEQIEAGLRDTERLEKGLLEQLKNSPLANVDYAEIRHYPDLQKKKQIEGQVLIALAVRIGKTRLIDNVILEIK
ncbi:pantoate--beta-alanine ligase [Caldalkalibacillus mannanilyticus]|uniref:pantoate--beta-alanine ligase n=1 Tax=Caldalkalibacillus mannanilyticus TaxID=1418 RepID=UPI0004698336|nr:pantoate--beta-alanine ligase [Caldalkalibacillus mannanilyticus]